MFSISPSLTVFKDAIPDTLIVDEKNNICLVVTKMTQV